MSDITLSKAVRSNLLHLQRTATQMGVTQERLATGLKVNSALDNPTNFFTASSLNARAGDLSNLLDSVSNAIQTVEAADNGITAITKLVETAQATVNQALQDRTNSSITTETAPGPVVGATDKATAEATTLGAVGFAVGDEVQIESTNATTGVTQSYTYTVGAVTDTVADLVTGINTSGFASAVISDTGVLSISGEGANSLTTTFKVADAGPVVGDLSQPIATALGFGAADSSVVAPGAGQFDEAVFTQAAAGIAASTERAGLAAQYNTLLDQIDQLAGDSGFNGINLLGGITESLSVTFNETGTSSIDLTGIDFTSAGLGLTATVGDFASDAEINAKIDDLKDGLANLRSQSRAFGANLSVIEARQNFTKDVINTLETGAANLTLADTNEEAANLLALQTRQQLSSTALSLASEADQNVLRLF